MDAAHDCIDVQGSSCTLSSDKHSVMSDSVDDGAKESQDINVHEGYCYSAGNQSDSDTAGFMSDNCAADAIEFIEFVAEENFTGIDSSETVPSAGNEEVGEDQSENELDLNCRKVSFNSASNLVVPISINGVPIKDVIDTAAQISVINTNFVEEHLPNLKFSGAYSLNGINADAPLCASMSEEICLGNKVFKWKVLKADIADSCILGLDFIVKYKLDIRLSENTLSVGDSVIPMEVKAVRPFKSYTVNTVSLFKKIKIKLHSGINFSLRLNSKFQSDAEFVVFEPVNHPSVDILSVMSLKDEDLPITIFNNTNKTVTLKRGSVLGVLADVADSNVVSPDFKRPDFEIRTLYADEFRDCYPAVKSENFTKIQQTLPDHLQDLFKRSCTHITLYQSVKLANLLGEFATIFSKSDTDLGHFKAVYHRIITRNNDPIKARMRRTPIHFEAEEEANLKKMLDAGVITESCSEYAHPVCLVRKKDGSVRWCIDTRVLNSYTVKDRFPLPKIEQCLDTLCGNRFDTWFSVWVLANRNCPWRSEENCLHNEIWSFWT